jgi:hypothetical protein
MITAKVLGLALLAVCIIPLGCAKKHEPEGYRVVGYDAATHQWTILRNGTFGGKYLRKRMTVVCSFYQWGNHPMVEGPDQCDLNVGDMLIENYVGKGGEYLDVDEMPGDDTLAISEGDSSDPSRVRQQFNILKEEVLPEGAK